MYRRGVDLPVEVVHEAWVLLPVAIGCIFEPWPADRDDARRPGRRGLSRGWATCRGVARRGVASWGRCGFSSLRLLWCRYGLGLNIGATKGWGRRCRRPAARPWLREMQGSGRGTHTTLARSTQLHISASRGRERLTRSTHPLGSPGRRIHDSPTRLSCTPSHARHVTRAAASCEGRHQLAGGAAMMPACPSSLGSIGGHVAGRARASSAACRWLQAGVAAQEGCVRGRLCSSSMSSSMWSKTH